MEGDAANPVTDPAAPQRPANPWWIVVAMVLCLTVGLGAIAHYVLGMLIKVLSAEFGWSRGSVSTGIALFLAGGSVSFVAFGYVIDRFGPRIAVIASACLTAVPLLAVPLVTTELQFYLALLAAGLLGGGTTIPPFVKAITSRFTSRRGLALGIGSTGSGVGGLVLPFYMVFMLANYGWREAILGLALLIVGVSVPAALLWLPRRVPRRAAPEPPLERPANAFAYLYRSTAFRLIVMSILFIAFSVNGIVVHAVALLTDRGLSAGQAAAAMSGVAIASLLARVVSGYLMDLFFAPRLVALLFMLLTGGVLLLIFGGAGPWVFFGLLMVGFTLGAEIDAMNYLVSRYCPLALVGQATGITYAVFTLSGSAAVGAFGHLFDLFGSYEVGLTVAGALGVLAALVVLRLGPYPSDVEAAH